MVHGIWLAEEYNCQNAQVQGPKDFLCNLSVFVCVFLKVHCLHLLHPWGLSLGIFIFNRNSLSKFAICLFLRRIFFPQWAKLFDKPKSVATFGVTIEWAGVLVLHDAVIKIKIGLGWRSLQRSLLVHRKVQLFSGRLCQEPCVGWKAPMVYFGNNSPA